MLRRILILVLCIVVIGVGLKLFYPKKRTVDQVVIITMDTTRADHFNCYGYPDNTTPFINEIARKGVLFENLFGVVGLTLPMHSTIMTGMTPASHAVHINNMHRLHPSRTTLAELFRKKKYTTGAFVSSFILNRRFGLNQGFQVYQDTFKVSRKGSPRLPLERQATETAPEALKWMKQHKSEQFFLWIHFYDPHFTYDPPEPFKTAFKKNPYDGEIAFTDYWVGKVWAQLRKQSDNYLFVLTADHGESMGEHGEETHGFFAYQAQLHIPLILEGTHVPKGVRVKKVVRSIDIAPTICEQAGLVIPKAMEGQTLLNFDSERKDLPVYQESWTPTGFKWSAITALVKYPWKFIDLPKPELYRLDNDSKELHNLFGNPKNAKVVEQMRSELREYLATRQKPDNKVTNVDLDPQTLERLRSLGYVSGKVTLDEVVSNVNKADPKDKIGVFRKYQQAQGAISAKKYDMGIQLFRELLKEEPMLAKFHLDLALAYNEDKKFDDAINEAQLALKLDPESPDGDILMGEIEDSRGNIDKAVVDFKNALKKTPKNLFIRSRLGEIFVEKHAYVEAGKMFRSALRFAPRHPYLLNNLGFVLIASDKDFDKGIELIRKADAIRPDDGFIKESLGSALFNKGDYVEARKNLERAQELLGNEPRLISYLKQTYQALKMDDKVSEMEQILNNPENTAKEKEGIE